VNNENIKDFLYGDYDRFKEELKSGIPQNLGIWCSEITDGEQTKFQNKIDSMIASEFEDRRKTK
jgi:hypothetical protein